MTAAVDPAQVPAGLDIEARSFAIIDAEARERERFGPADWPVARRMIHAAGDVGVEEHFLRGKARRNDRARRAHRLGEEQYHQPHRALLRAAARAHHDGRERFADGDD